MDERQVTGRTAPVETHEGRESRPAAGRRLALDEIRADWLTVAEFAAWSGVSRNSAYEVLRQDPMRAHVQHFGRQIRISKKALARLVDGAS
jgi:hypothetical protein